MFRVCIVARELGVLEGKNFSSRKEAEDYILSIAEKHGVKKGYIENLDTKEKEIIEDL